MLYFYSQRLVDFVFPLKRLTLLTAVACERHRNTGVIAKRPGPSLGSEKPERDGVITGSFGLASLRLPLCDG